MKKYEERQQRVLEYMKKTIADRGFPPTVREICAALQIKSTSTVFKDLKALETQGLIHKDPSKPRALTIVGAPPSSGTGSVNSDSAAGTADTASASHAAAGFQSFRPAASPAPASPASPFYGTPVDETTTTLIPIIGDVAAGTPILAEENVDEYIPFPNRFLGRGNHFILTVHGDSMINVGINDGDYIIVKEEHEAVNGEIVVAMISGEYESEATVKRFYRENGHIRLQPENDYMDPIIVPGCDIIGKVRGVFRYLN